MNYSRSDRMEFSSESSSQFIDCATLTDNNSDGSDSQMKTIVKMKTLTMKTY